MVEVPNQEIEFQIYSESIQQNTSWKYVRKAVKIIWNFIWTQKPKSEKNEIKSWAPRVCRKCLIDVSGFTSPSKKPKKPNYFSTFFLELTLFCFFLADFLYIL